MSAMTFEEFARRYGITPQPRPKKHSRPRSAAFVPTEAQLGTARNRIVAALTRKGGTVHIDSFDETVAFCTKHVFNRGRELGDYRNGEFKIVVTIALEQLMRLKVIEIDDDLGTLRLIKKPPRRKQSFVKRRAVCAA